MKPPTQSTSQVLTVIRPSSASRSDILLTNISSESEKSEILEMRNSPKLYSKMMESVCPNVFGHPEVGRSIHIVNDYSLACFALCLF